MPKTKGKPSIAGPARMEEVVVRLHEAFDKVAANKGAPGPDGQTIEYVREHLESILPRLGASLLAGSYMPGDVRRKWIPKAGGTGQRGLGIPNVVDRVVQEAGRCSTLCTSLRFIDPVMDFARAGAAKRRSRKLKATSERGTRS